MAFRSHSPSQQRDGMSSRHTSLRGIEPSLQDDTAGAAATAVRVLLLLKLLDPAWSLLSHARSPRLLILRRITLSSLTHACHRVHLTLLNRLISRTNSWKASSTLCLAFADAAIYLQPYCCAKACPSVADNQLGMPPLLSKSPTSLLNPSLMVQILLIADYNHRECVPVLDA